MSKKILHSIKFSEETNKLLDQMRNTFKPSKTFNNMVETLVENNEEFIFFKKKKKHERRHLVRS